MGATKADLLRSPGEKRLERSGCDALSAQLGGDVVGHLGLIAGQPEFDPARGLAVRASSDRQVELSSASARLDRLRQLMNEAVRDCLVYGHGPLSEGLMLPDPGDRHVLAAAIRTGAQVVVTSNLKHFPAADLRQWGIEAKSPDADDCQVLTRLRIRKSDALSPL